MNKMVESNNRKYSIWKAMVFSFFSRDLYEDVGKEWKGVGFVYLLLLLALVFIPRSGKVQWEAGNKLPQFLKKIPDFKIEKGEFSANVQQPYTIEMAKGVLVIDTTGKIDSLDQITGVENKEYILLVNKTKFMTRRSRFGKVEDKTQNMLKLNSFSVDQEKLSRWSAAIKPWVGIGYYLFCVLFGFLFEIFVLIIYALFGVLFSEIIKAGLDYNVSLRLAVISHIPALFISSLMVTCGVLLPAAPFWSFLVSMGYLFFAVKSQELVKN